jgi:hypothetical protein
MKLQAQGYDAFIYVCHLLGEAGIAGTPLGGNVIELPDQQDFPPEVQDELARWTTGGPFDASPPVDVESGVGATPPVVGLQPLAPAALSPLPQPPKTGPGATRVAWARYARQRTPPVVVLDSMSRDDIIRAVEAPPDDC